MTVQEYAAAEARNAVREFCRDIGVDPAVDKVEDIKRWVEQGKAADVRKSALDHMASEREARINTAGWGHPLNARVWHYFKAGSLQSLCGRWAFAGSRDSQNPKGGGKDDCASCSRLVAKL